MKTGPKPGVDGKCFFAVWAPEKESMFLNIIHPSPRIIPMQKDDTGYFTLNLEDVGAGTRYFLQPDGAGDFPDPASNFQPDGVHGPSQVVDHSAYKWNDQKWKGIPLKDLILYELHVGTFSGQGTFDAVTEHLSELYESGINAIEIMPVAQFPGGRNWGYDGVYPYSVQNTYGGPDGLKRLVDSAHQTGIAVFLDVVYNHIGPEGNYFQKFGPYFTAKYQVPWGDAVNFDDAWSDGVKEYFTCNACHWFENYHVDGLRLDAIHTIFDAGATQFWEMLGNGVRQLEQLSGRNYYLIAESDLNDPKVIKKIETGGYGFDAQWLDDYHHALYVLLHPGGKERYEDFGTLEQFAKALKDGFVHSGEYVRFRKKKYGATSAGIAGDRFVVFNQNHDQVGNRVLGERLSILTGPGQLKMAAAALILSPYIPMIFMGEEYGDENPFFYFVSHSDPDLVKAVREGRKKEFEAFSWKVEPPDPQDVSTFNRSKINWDLRNTGKHRILLEWNKELISLRRSKPALKNMKKDGINTYIHGKEILGFTRSSEDGKDQLLCILNFSEKESRFIAPALADEWVKVLDSAEPGWKLADEIGVPAPTETKAGEQLTVSGWSVIVYENLNKKKK
jgi:maltooligosyltrehalose trehalohydrolase